MTMMDANHLKMSQPIAQEVKVPLIQWGRLCANSSSLGPVTRAAATDLVLNSPLSSTRLWFFKREKLSWRKSESTMR